MTRNDIQDYAARYNISADECDRIAAVVTDESEFAFVWGNHDWWTDENNA